ncbi:hypothetical protein [Candidatus Regiella endosymbiont of Tuberolachnus salignus]
MSVDKLRDSANTRSQQRGSFKGEGYIKLTSPYFSKPHNFTG